MSKKQPTGQEIMALSENEDLVNKQLYMMKTVPSDSNFGPILKNMDEHLAYWDKMEKKGVMFAAGPNVPDEPTEEWSGEGIVVFKADSRAEAERIAQQDPMHRSGARTYELQPWLLNHLNTNALGTANMS